LPRGAEVATGIVQKEGIITQDIGTDTSIILDDEQIDTCKKLSIDDTPINGYLTFKADGSLCSISRYTGKALYIMSGIIDAFGSDYVKLWKEMSLKLSNSTVILVPATHRTLIESGFMGNYMVTACLVGSKIVNRDMLDGLDYITAWATYGNEFVQRILSMRVYDSFSDVHTFIFEAICKRRTSAFDFISHTELACSYDIDMIVFLGMSICEKRFYIPHMIYGKENNIPFDEPLWWTITNSNQIIQMIRWMEELIFQRVTKGEFITMFKPHNTIIDIDSIVIDYEGWVFMKNAAFESDDIDHKCVGIEQTIYSKIKTLAYYKSHKFKERNIEYLMMLGKVAGHIFPMSNAVNQMLPDGIISQMLINICRDIRLKFDFRPNTELMKRLDVINKEGVARGKKDSMNNFDKRPPKSKFCSALSHDSIIDNWIFDIFMMHIPRFEVVDKPSIIKMFKKLIIDLAIWEDDYTNYITKMKSSDPILVDLIAIYFK
jgi:hypothetical protein